MCYPPNFLSCIIKLKFRILDLVNFIFNFGFLFLDVQKFLSSSLFDFSANLNPNRVIFFCGFAFEFLSKSIKITNLSPQFIVLFDQILKHTSKKP